MFKCKFLRNIQVLDENNKSCDRSMLLWIEMKMTNRASWNFFFSIEGWKFYQSFNIYIAIIYTITNMHRSKKKLIGAN